LREWLNFGPGDQMEAHYKMIQDVVANDIRWKGVGSSRDK